MKSINEFHVALVWPPLSENFTCSRFGPRVTLMSHGYLEAHLKDIDDVVCHQINLDEMIYGTPYWDQVEAEGVLEEAALIEDYLSGEYQSELLDRIYDYILHSFDWSDMNLISVGYDINYLQDKYTLAFFRFLKTVAEEFGIPVMIGGLGSPSMEIIRFFRRFKFIKYMAFGTLDSINLDSFKKIVLYEKDGNINLEEAQNICYRNEKSVAKTNIYEEPPKSSIERDYILKPVYHLAGQNAFRTTYADLKKYDKGFPDKGFNESVEVPIIPYRFSVGCVNQCAFCMSSGDGKVFAFKPAEKVADDLEMLMQENESNYFMFLNSMVNFSKKYLDELLNIMKKRNLDIYFTDSAEVHGMDDEMLQIIKEMGAVALWYGLECPSDKILKLINKRCTVAESIEVLKKSNQMGIWNGVNLIAGLPHEKDEDIDGTVDFIRSNTDIVDMWQVTPFHLVKSKFLEEPDKYGIEVKGRVVTGDMVMATFDEVGGLCWREKHQKTALGFKRILDAIADYSAIPNLTNATFVFHAYTRFGKNGKQEIRKWLQENYIGKAPAPEAKVTGIF